MKRAVSVIWFTFHWKICKKCQEFCVFSLCFVVLCPWSFGKKTSNRFMHFTTLPKLLQLPQLVTRSAWQRKIHNLHTWILAMITLAKKPCPPPKKDKTKIVTSWLTARKLPWIRKTLLDSRDSHLVQEFWTCCDLLKKCSSGDTILCPSSSSVSRFQRWQTCFSSVQLAESKWILRLRHSST